MPSVLLVLEELELAANITHILETEGFSVVVMSNGRDGFTEFQAGEASFVLLSSTLPDVNHLELCRQMCGANDVPVIVLCDGGEQSVVACLGAGADDCIARSTSGPELVARIQAVSRRSIGKDSSGPLSTVGGYRIDRRSRTVTSCCGAQVDLTNLEFDLLVLFITNPGAALERELIFNRVWGQTGLGTSRTIDTHVLTLRSKLPNLNITTVHGVGYRLETSALAA